LRVFNELNDAGDWDKGAALWDRLIASNPTNATIVGQAAVYRSWDVFRPQDRTVSLFENACHLDPKNPRWPRLLGKMYSQLAYGLRDSETAGKALAMLERAASLTNAPLSLEDYTELTQAASTAGQADKVFLYGTNATARLAHTDNNRHGDEIHNVNAMLCLAALHNGEKKMAGEYLLRAGHSPGSPVLDSFGPDFSYAAKMLKAGETNVVFTIP